MNVFGKQLQRKDPKDLPGRAEALERHVDYMQERIEYSFRQVEKGLDGEKLRGEAVQPALDDLRGALSALGEALADLEARVAALEAPQG